MWRVIQVLLQKNEVAKRRITKYNTQAFAFTNNFESKMTSQDVIQTVIAGVLRSLAVPDGKIKNVAAQGW
jgi:hypothetical protein